MNSEKKTPDPNRYQELKELLEKRLEEIAESMRRRRARLTESGNQKRNRASYSDFAEQMDISNEEDIDLALMKIEAATLDRINEAMKQFELGEYGVCSDCGKEIPSNRLRALLFATTCKPCEEKRESVTNQKRLHREKANYFPLLMAVRD